jgi:ribosomal protein S18 acetylase RimI-like enzyme
VDLKAPLTVRPALTSEWARLRDIRLRALADAPQAFGSTLAVERQLPAETWKRRALASDRRTMLAATDGNLWAGFAGWVLEEDGIGQLVSMWVEPAWRRRGVASALVGAVVERHLRSGASELRLWVSVPNLAARRCYEANGFSLTGRTQPLPSDPKLEELEMRFETALT